MHIVHSKACLKLISLSAASSENICHMQSLLLVDNHFGMFCCVKNGTSKGTCIQIFSKCVYIYIVHIPKIFDSFVGYGCTHQIDSVKLLIHLFRD